MTSGDAKCGLISWSMFLDKYSRDGLNGKGRLRCTVEAAFTGVSL
jgi:hypothetical protein